MTEQIRASDMVELLRADFFGRNEPNAAWSHAVSDHMLLPALRGFWPMSINHVGALAIYIDDLACGYDLEMINTPELQLIGLGLPPCCGFTAANSEYLTYGADDVQHDISGTETTIITAQRGLTLGGWFKFSTLGAQAGLIHKWEQTVGNQRSYGLFKTAANQITFAVSTNGIASVIVTSAGTVAINTWYHIVGRFVPSTTIDVYVDAVRTSNAVGIPASLFNSTESLQIGRWDRANYLDGYASLCWLSASTCWDGVAGTRDLIPWALYEHSKVMFKG